MPHPYSLDWDIHREGRAWREDEMERYFRTSAKIECVDGRLFWNAGDRLMLLAMLLENVGADAAVRFGDPEVWREAVATLPK